MKEPDIVGAVQEILDELEDAEVDLDDGYMELWKDLDELEELNFHND